MTVGAQPLPQSIGGGAGPVYTEWLRERLRNGRYQGWLMTAADGPVMAVVGLWLIDWPTRRAGPGAIPGLCVQRAHERAHRKQEYSRRSMRTLLDACVAQGIHVVGLHASAEGRPIYAALGFKDTNEMRIVLPQERDGSGPDPVDILHSDIAMRLCEEAILFWRLRHRASPQSNILAYRARSRVST